MEIWWQSERKGTKREGELEEKWRRKLAIIGEKSTWGERQKKKRKC